MEKEVNQNAVLQVIVELSNQLIGTKLEIQQQVNGLQQQINDLQQQIEHTRIQLTNRIEGVENNLSTKIDSVYAKAHVLSQELLETKADVLLLKQVKSF